MKHEAATTDSGAHIYNLVIVHTPGSQELSDWNAVKEKINLRAPEIDVRIVSNFMLHPEITEWQLSRPSLVFSPVRLIKYRPAGGKIYSGRALDKLVASRRLADAGVATPRTMTLAPGLSLDPAVWGEYVVVKPASPRATSFGHGLALARAESVGDRFGELTGQGRLRMIVQKLVDAADEAGRLYAYRVLTMFERPLYAVISRQLKKRLSLADIHDEGSNAIAHNVEGAKRERIFVNEADVLELAARAAKAMQEMPVLGVDIVRERSTGQLYVLETNSGGNCWHLSSRLVREQSHKERRKRYNQFGALDVAADALIEKTRREATLLTPAGFHRG
jgi:hypothetical protein